ncbi:MAG TPA: oxalate:formate antiporter [Candidatus Eisenbacteria bacterium]|nr:oxalate:formate antiporter [Candidatus Eisenbacteria bacterium]
MSEFILPAHAWPAMPPPHRAFLERALPVLRADARLVGVAAGGSFIAGVLDEHSDLDLVVVSRAEAAADVLAGGQDLARRLGTLLVAFPGDHVGELRLLVCLYGSPLLHVDFKFVSTGELRHRVEDPTILWDRTGEVRAVLSETGAVYPPPDLQWIEDRFWPWMHYLGVKIARGELFEAIDGLGFVRAHVLGPLALSEAGAQPNGVRRVEQSVPDRAGELRATVPAHEAASCRRALAATVALYADLRDRISPPTLVRRAEAEDAVRTFLELPPRCSKRS